MSDPSIIADVIRPLNYVAESSSIIMEVAALVEMQRTKAGWTEKVEVIQPVSANSSVAANVSILSRELPTYTQVLSDNKFATLH